MPGGGCGSWSNRDRTSKTRLAHPTTLPSRDAYGIKATEREEPLLSSYVISDNNATWKRGRSFLFASPFFYRRRVQAILSVVWVTAARTHWSCRAAFQQFRYYSSLPGHTDSRLPRSLLSLSLSLFLSLSVPGNGEVTAAASYYRPPVLLLRRRSSSSHDDSFTIWYPARWMRSTLAWITGLFRSCATLPRESWPAVPQDSTRLLVGHRLLTYSLFLSLSRNSNRAGFFATC